MTIIDAVYTVLNMHLHIYIQLANVYALHFTNVHLQCVWFVSQYWRLVWAVSILYWQNYNSYKLPYNFTCGDFIDFIDRRVVWWCSAGALVAILGARIPIDIVPLLRICVLAHTSLAWALCWCIFFFVFESRFCVVMICILDTRQTCFLVFPLLFIVRMSLIVFYHFALSRATL